MTHPGRTEEVRGYNGGPDGCSICGCGNHTTETHPHAADRAELARLRLLLGRARKVLEPFAVCTGILGADDWERIGLHRLYDQDFRSASLLLKDIEEMGK